MQKLRLKQWRMFSNVEATSVARIVVLWNPSTVNVDSIDSSPQDLHVIIRNLELSSPVLPPLSMVTTLLVLAGPFGIVFGVPFITASCLMVWICWLCLFCWLTSAPIISIVPQLTNFVILSCLVNLSPLSSFDYNLYMCVYLFFLGSMFLLGYICV